MHLGLLAKRLDVTPIEVELDESKTIRAPILEGIVILCSVNRFR
jgi:hypothetical protein